jgi:hypothetical protein
VNPNCATAPLLRRYHATLRRRSGAVGAVLLRHCATPLGGAVDRRAVETGPSFGEKLVNSAATALALSGRIGSPMVRRKVCNV